MTLNKKIALLFALIGNIGFSQPSNDNCGNAIQLCPDLTLTGTTQGATTGADDYDFCYTSENSIWYVFTTNSIGGGVTVNFSNLTFNPDPDFGQELQALFFKTSGSCGVTPFTPASSCGSSGVDFNINEIVILDPNTTYYVQVSGTSVGATNPSECEFDIDISGTGIETPDPTVTISIDNTSICQNTDEPITVDITNCNDTVNYNWVYDGGSVYSGSENNFTTAGLNSDGVLELIITCGDACPKTANSNSINLDVTLVSAEAGEDQFINLNEQASLTGSGIGSPTWSPGSSLTNINTLNTIASPAGSTTYFLTMENDGCFASDSVTIFVGEILTIYSAFSPNGDGINDRWHIINSEKFPNMEIAIYDRSGQLVFSAINYTLEEQWWDGTFKGKSLPTSSYYYVIRLNNAENTEYKGYVTIIR